MLIKKLIHALIHVNFKTHTPIIKIYQHGLNILKYILGPIVTYRFGSVFFRFLRMDNRNRTEIFGYYKFKNRTGVIISVRFFQSSFFGFLLTPSLRYSIMLWIL